MILYRIFHSMIQQGGRNPGKSDSMNGGGDAFRVFRASSPHACTPRWSTVVRSAARQHRDWWAAGRMADSAKRSSIPRMLAYFTL